MLSAHKEIVLASGNPGKIREIQAILHSFHVLPQSQFKITEAPENACTFVENAISKARNAALQTQYPSLADDSGLVVDALQGAPGVISARYAGEGASDLDNLNKLLIELEDIPEPQRTARFVCVMVYMEHAYDPFPIIAQGVWEGSILHQPCGENGFGYDPVFWVPQYRCSSAQLLPAQKNAISHRAAALQTLTQQLLT